MKNTLEWAGKADLDRGSRDEYIYLEIRNSMIKATTFKYGRVDYVE